MDHIAPGPWQTTPFRHTDESRYPETKHVGFSGTEMQPSWRSFSWCYASVPESDYPGSRHAFTPRSEAELLVVQTPEQREKPLVAAPDEDGDVLDGSV